MKKKLISLILALAMVFSLCGTAGAEKLSEVTVTGSQNYTYAFQVLELVNQQRAKEGLEPLTMDVSLLETAMLRAAECSVLFDHIRPDGSCCFTANELMYAENIASGYEKPETVMTGWMNSDGHRANILTEGYTTIGIGCVEVDGVVYWAQCFGMAGDTPASLESYSNSNGVNTWQVTVSDEVVYDDRYYLQQGSLIYMVENGQAAVYLCDETAAGAITIPASVEGYPVTSIDFAAFAGCEEITSVTIPDSVTSIGYNAFYGCTRLAQVSIPASVSFVGMNAFFNTLSFRKAYTDGVVYLDNWLLFVDADLEGSFTVAEGTVGIAEMAFLSCAGITDVTVPASVLYVNDRAFGGCTSLCKITFQGGAPVIGEEAFQEVEADVECAYEDGSWSDGAARDYGGTLTWQVPRFLDLPEEAWYTPFVNQAAELGLMDGVGGHCFQPLSTTTRAMFVQILYALEGKPEVEGENPFTDVDSEAWYGDAVQWAYENQVTEGTSHTTFSPNKNVSREEIAVFLYAYYGRPETAGDLSAFADRDQVHSWAVPALLWATQNGVISGAGHSDGTLSLNPLAQATRAETATMMVGFYDLVTGSIEEIEDAEADGETGNDADEELTQVA